MFRLVMAHLQIFAGMILIGIKFKDAPFAIGCGAFVFAIAIMLRSIEEAIREQKR